jgi:gas vesicle protein
MDQIWSVIGQYAFPIVACVVMGWYVKYIQDNYRQDISDISSRHKEEMDKVTEALNNNTQAIQKLTDYIERL